MALLLNVNYNEKDEVKALGANWDSRLKKWYVKDKVDYPKFSKWILKDQSDAIVVCDYFYIIEGKQDCFKCGSETNVIGFGLENYLYIYEDEESRLPEFERASGEIHIASSLSFLSAKLLAYLKDKYNYYLGYSKTTASSYYANHCKHCNVLQGNFFLFDEVDSPFYIDSAESAQALRLYRVKLNNDIIVQADISYGSEDYLIKDYGQIVELKNEFNM